MAMPALREVERTTMIARIKFDYDGREARVKASENPEHLAVLKDIFGDALPSTPEHLALSYMWPEELVIDLDTDGPRLTALGITFSIKSFKGTMPLNAILPEGHDCTVYVQVPHIGLLAIDEVQVCENYCTDQLQRDLNNGWRIICVCPPNAARRPDYILGRTKER
jgi:hypothetical protein